MKKPGLFYLPRRAKVAQDFSEDAFIEMMSSCRVYEISGGVDFEAATTFCMDLMDENNIADSANVQDLYAGLTRQITISRLVKLPDTLRIARYRKSPELGPKLLFFSGGTALNPLSRKITEYTHNSIHLITPFDSGGSSVKLRRAFDMLSVGDLRSRLMALADRSVSGHPEIYDLFTFRFPQDFSNDDLKKWLLAMADGIDLRVARIPDPMRKIIRHHLSYFIEAMPSDFDLKGASVGNLILAGGYLNNKRHLDPVLFMFSRLVKARGIVRTVTGENMHLIARLENGEVVRGQRDLTGKEVGQIKSPVAELFLSNNIDSARPEKVKIRKKVRDLISQAELICYPMGSFYSSLIANLLPEGVGDEISNNHCPKIYIPSTGDDPELYGVSLAQSVIQLIYYLKKGCKNVVATDRLINFIVVDEKQGRYNKPLGFDVIAKLGVEVIRADLITEPSKPKLDEEKLIEILLSLT